MIDVSEINQDLCNRISRLDIEGWLLNFFKKYFSDANNIELDVLKNRLYNETNPGILIADGSALDYKLIEKRPAILIFRHKTEIKKLTILGGSFIYRDEKPDGIQDIVLNNYVIYYIISCIGRTPGESDIIAWEVQGIINKLTRSLALTIVAPILNVIEISGPKIIPESDREYITTLVLQCEINLINKVFKVG